MCMNIFRCIRVCVCVCVCVCRHRQLVYPGPYPGDVDVARRELFMLDDDFTRVFGGLTRAEFGALPMWQQHRKKQDAMLF